MENLLRRVLKGLIYVVGAAAWIRGISTISSVWGWQSLPAVAAVFLPPVPVFLAPLYEGFVEGSWTAAGLVYGVGLALAVPGSILEERFKKRSAAASAASPK